MNQLKMTQLGKALLGICTNKKHIWTSIQLYGTSQEFKQCIKCWGVKK